jgi:hypothetical protein
MSEEDKLYETLNSQILESWVLGSMDLVDIHTKNGEHHLSLAAYYLGRANKIEKILLARKKTLDDTKGV